MKLGTVVMSVGLGMVAGAAVAAILPKQPQFKRVVNQTADSIETAVEDAKTFLSGD